MKNYYPILASKTGELDALRKLDKEVKKDICPVIEIIESTIYKSKKDRDTKKYYQTYDDAYFQKLDKYWSFDENQIFIDFNTLDNIQAHLGFIKKLFGILVNQDMNFGLVVQSNSNKKYKRIVQELCNDYEIQLCARFSNSSGGFLNLDSEIKDILDFYDIELGDLSLLIDLGKISEDNYNVNGSTVGLALKGLKNYNLSEFDDVIVSSSSFPKDLGGFEDRDEPHIITRFEKLLFDNLTKSGLDIKYSDYGSKSADSEDVRYMGSISLKYSTLGEYIIFRGVRTIDHKLGHNQFIKHCRNLVTMKEYHGDDYSHGDKRYQEISEEDLVGGSPGNSTQWVEYSQNHHITMISNNL